MVNCEIFYVLYDIIVNIYLVYHMYVCSYVNFVCLFFFFFIEVLEMNNKTYDKHRFTSCCENLWIRSKLIPNYVQ